MSTSGDADAGRSGESRIHFRDFLPGVNPRQTDDAPKENAPPLMTGSAADLAVLLGQAPAGKAQELSGVGGGDGQEQQPWTFVAPTVETSQARNLPPGSAPYRIYARIGEQTPPETLASPAASLERIRDNRR
ncbi:MAG: hypothetical protein HQL95_03060 [Magnetococcales bacterium]|nr:hypothetical protein [Magnetococcales bacterium]